MNFIRLTGIDGEPCLCDTTEIITLKQETEMDHVYNKEKHFTLIVFKNGMSIKVVDRFDDVEEKIKDLTAWP